MFVRRNLRRILVSLAALAPPAAALAGEESRWSLSVAPLLLQTYGNDPAVVRIDRPNGARESVTLDADDAIAYRAEVRLERPIWSWGIDFFWHRTDQGTGPLSVAGSAPPAAFQFPPRSFVAGPGQSLYYQVLEDTTIETWSADAFATRRVLASERGTLALRLGLKTADFDNDYRAIGGFSGGTGLRLDASSNYDRMHGPLVGLEGRVDLGRSRIEALALQSVVYSTVQLSVLYRDFSGTHSEDGAFTNPRRFSTTEDVTIPISELRLRWSHRVGERFSLGASAEAAFWWDLPLPPGIVAADPPQAQRESTVTFLGLGLTAVYRF